MRINRLKNVDLLSHQKHFITYLSLKKISVSIFALGLIWQLSLEVENPTHSQQTLVCFGQVESGSRTVLAIMGEEEMVSNVTGSLKLL